MEDKKELTKDLLTASFRELVLQIPFEKITIKMITDGAGVIRPTFYKHFQDKYEIIEWVFQTQVVDQVDVLINNHMEQDLHKLLFQCIYNEKDFFKKILSIQGPQSFESLLNRYLLVVFEIIFNRCNYQPPKELPFLSKDLAIHYLCYETTQFIRIWLEMDNPLPPKELSLAFEYLKYHSLSEFFNENE